MINAVVDYQESAQREIIAIASFYKFNYVNLFLYNYSHKLQLEYPAK